MWILLYRSCKFFFKKSKDGKYILEIPWLSFSKFFFRSFNGTLTNNQWWDIKIGTFYLLYASGS